MLIKNRIVKGQYYLFDPKDYNVSKKYSVGRNRSHCEVQNTEANRCMQVESVTRSTD